MKHNNNRQQFFQEKNKYLVLAVAALLITGALVVSTVMFNSPIFCTKSGYGAGGVRYGSQKTQLETILHYATSRVVPQQSNAEIRVTFDVLNSRSPCNFLVFGLGHDSPMWHSFNPGGTTLFLEEDPKWVQTVLADSPFLHARHVQYRTQLSEADKLMRSYRAEPDCMPSRNKGLFLRRNERCRLALNALPEEVYEKEWDLIMLDAPRGYYDEAPGRMAAIYSAMVMARNRKGEGVTHVFLHDVDRKVEKAYAEEFLCRKYLVKAEGRLWHFQIPSAVNTTSTSADFC